MNSGTAQLGSPISIAENKSKTIHLLFSYVKDSFLDSFSYVKSKVSKLSKAVRCSSNKPPELLRYQYGKYGPRFELGFRHFSTRLISQNTQ